MKWFFNWLRNGLDTLDKENREEETERYNPLSDRKYKVGLAIPKNRVAIAGGSSHVDSEGNVHLHQQPMHFKIYPATGGHIVEYTYYDEKRDQNNQALHLIPSELDLGAEIAKIMTLEALKR
jgi:hypothetical protein